eukprot:14943360-Heterocapsa_arctica.AAC.1
MLESTFETQNWSQAEISCAERSAFCEESNGDREDARRPFKSLSNLQKPSKPYTPVCVHL